MPDPLKGKAFELDPQVSAEEGSAFWYKDVKSAVYGLLSELENEMKDREKSSKRKADCDREGALFQSGFAGGLRHAKYLVKKWLPDVFTEKERKPMETEELKELFRKHNIGFEDICRFWITTYPEDIFSEKTSVGKITRLMKKILEEKERGKE